MNDQLRIAIADDEPVMQRFLQDVLTRMNHSVVAVASNGRQLVEQCKEHAPDLVITDIKMPDMDGLDAAREICRERQIPIIIVSAYHDQEFLNRAAENFILAYLIKPIKDTDLGPAITVAMHRFSEFEELQSEADSIRKAMDDRKIIDQAKRILMTHANLDEPTAFRRLQKQARGSNQKLVDVAAIIVSTVNVLGPSDRE